MAIHRKLKTTALEAVASVAQTALSTARSSQTATNGTISVRNADGTRTVIGTGAGIDETGGSAGVAQFVGDTTPPSTPTGVTFACTADGCVLAVWDGTLEEGIPADFDHVNLYVGSDKYARTYDEDTGAELGEAGETAIVGGEPYAELECAGSVQTVPLFIENEDQGDEVECWATAVDVQGNESDATEFYYIWLTNVAGEVEELAGDASEAKALAESLAESITDIETTVDELTTTVSGAVETATEALTVATTVETSLTEWQAEVDAVLYQTDEDGETVSIADMVTSLSASLDGIVAYVGEDYEDTTLDEVLSQYATTEWTESEIASVVSSTLYETDEDGNLVYDDDGNPIALYATSSELEETADGIRSEVYSELYDDAGDPVYIESTEVIQEAGGITTYISNVVDGVDVTNLIRETSEGVEVASIEDGEYTSTRTLMGAGGVQVDICTDTDAEDPQWQTGLSIDSDSVDIYSNGKVGMHIDADSVGIYDAADPEDIEDETATYLAKFSANPGTAYSYTELISSGALRISGGKYGEPLPVYINPPLNDEGDETDTGIGLIPTESGNEDIPWDWTFHVVATKSELYSSDNNLCVPVFIGRGADYGSSSTKDLTAGSLTGVPFKSTYRHFCTADLVTTTTVAYGSFGFAAYAGSSSKLTVAEIAQGGVYLITVGTYFADDDGTSHLAQVRMLPSSSSTSSDVVTLCEQQGPGELKTPFAMGVFELDAGNVLAWGVRAQGSGDTVNWGTYSSQVAIIYLGTA